MPWYRVRLRITDAHASADQLDALGAAGVLVWRRGDDTSVTVEAINAGDPSGALARTQNLVLDIIGGDIVSGEFAVTEAPEPKGRWARGSA